MSKSTWRIVEWTGNGGRVAELNAAVPINAKGRQPVTYSISFDGTGEIEIDAADAAILIAAKAAER